MKARTARFATNSPPRCALLEFFLCILEQSPLFIQRTMNLHEQCPEINPEVISKVIYEKQMSPWRKSVAFESRDHIYLKP